MVKGEVQVASQGFCWRRAETVAGRATEAFPHLRASVSGLPSAGSGEETCLRSWRTWPGTRMKQILPANGCDLFAHHPPCLEVVVVVEVG